MALALRNQTARGGPAAGRAPFWGKLIRFPRRVARERNGIDWPRLAPGGSTGPQVRLSRIDFPGSTFRDRLSGIDFPGSTLLDRLSRVDFPGSTFQGRLSRVDFPGSTFQGRLSRVDFPGSTFQGRLSRVDWPSIAPCARAAPRRPGSFPFSSRPGAWDRPALRT